jgi:hypothetical protein
MPQRPTEFDEVQYLLQQALVAIRESHPGDLATEQLRSKIYNHVANAVDEIVNYAYVAGPRLDDSPKHSPKRRPTRSSSIAF